MHATWRMNLRGMTRDFFFLQITRGTESMADMVSSFDAMFLRLVIQMPSKTRKSVCLGNLTKHVWRDAFGRRIRIASERVTSHFMDSNANGPERMFFLSSWSRYDISELVRKGDVMAFTRFTVLRTTFLFSHRFSNHRTLNESHTTNSYAFVEFRSGRDAEEAYHEMYVDIRLISI